MSSELIKVNASIEEGKESSLHAESDQLNLALQGIGNINYNDTMSSFNSVLKEIKRHDGDVNFNLDDDDGTHNGMDEAHLLNVLLDSIITDQSILDTTDKSNMNQLRQRCDSLERFEQILSAQIHAPTQTFLKAVSPLAAKHGLGKQLVLMEDRLEIMMNSSLKAKPESPISLRSTILVKAKENREELNRDLIEQGHWQGLLDCLVNLLFSSYVQSQRSAYSEKLQKLGYQDFLKSLMADPTLATKINEDRLFCATSKTLEEKSACEAWERLASSELRKEKRKQEIEEIAKSILACEPPKASIYSTRNVQDPMNPNVKMNRESLEMNGGVIKASEVIQILKAYKETAISMDNTTGKVHEICVYAMYEFIMDEDIILPGVNVIIFSPKWEVTYPRTIDLSGRKGKDPDPKPLKPNMPAHHISIPDRGTKGKAGHPGESSGNLMLAGLSAVDQQKLTIRLDGGDGGAGQDAGDGADARDVEYERMTIDKISGEVSGYTSYEGFGTNYFFKTYFREEEDLLAKKGGDSGAFGAGGLPGNAGRLIRRDEREVGAKEHEGSKGREGAVGKEGNPGKGAQGYKHIKQKVTKATKSYPIGTSPVVDFLTPHFLEWMEVPSYLLKDLEVTSEKLESSSGSQIMRRSSDSPCPSVLQQPIMPWKFATAYGQMVHDSNKTTLTILNRIPASLISTMAQTVEFYTPPCISSIEDIIYHLALDEMMGDCREHVMWKWQSFEAGLKELFVSQSRKATAKTSLPILHAIQQKIGCTIWPINGLDAVGTSLEGGYPYVWNLESFVHFLDLKLSYLKEFKRQEFFSQSEAKYKAQIDLEIQNAEQDSTKLYAVLISAISKIDKEISKIQNEIQLLISQTHTSIEQMKQMIQNYYLFLTVKIILSSIQVALSIGSVFLPVLAPISAITSGIIDAGLSVGESVVKEKFTPLKVTVPEISFKDTYGFTPDEDMKNIKELLQDLKSIEDDAKFEKRAAEIKQKLHKEWEAYLEEHPKDYILEGMLRARMECLEGFPDHANELAKYESELDAKEKALEERIERWDAAAKRTAEAVNTTVNSYNSCISTYAEIQELEATKESLEKQFKALKDLSTFLETTRKDIHSLEKALETEMKSYSKSPTSAIIVSYATFSNCLERLSCGFRKLQTDMKINSEVCEEIGTTGKMFAGIVDIYKHVAHCKHQKDFAGYIADLHQEGKDSDLLAVNTALEAHYLATQYFKIIEALKHYTIAMGIPNSFWMKAPQFSIERQRFTTSALVKDLTWVYTEVIKMVKERLIQDSAFITPLDQLVKLNAEHITRPWTYNEFPSVIHHLAKGEVFKLFLDSEFDNCMLDLFMFKDVALKITHADSKINACLQKFLSMNAEAVIRRSGQSKFRLGQEVYILPISNPPPLSHVMGKGTKGNLSRTCNQALGKLRSEKSSSVLSPFGGAWSINVKFTNLEKPVLLSPVSDLKDVEGLGSLSEESFQQGLEVRLQFKGQCFDFAIDPSMTAKRRKMMQDIMKPLQSGEHTHRVSTI